ncbi:MAG: hypothetical protein ACOYMF_05660 [Bacteroidales bacterium]
MNDSERIRKVLEYYKMSSNAFSKHIGLSTPQILYDIIKERNGISKDLAEKITAICLDINIGWLLTGAGDMLKSKQEEEMISNAVIRKSHEYLTTTAPLISQYAAAGYLSGFSDPEYIEQQPIYVATKKYSGGNYVAFEIRGDSMDDGLKHSISNSDVVLCKELKKDYWTCKLHIPKIFIIVHRTNGIICKEIIDHDINNGMITCHSFNPENRDFILNLNDVAQLFYIKEITRET